MTTLTLNNFKQYLINNNKSQNTIKNYMCDLQSYFKLYNSISTENILSYLNKLKSTNIDAQTYNRKLSSLKKYNEYLIEIKELDSLYILNSYKMKIQQKGNPTIVTNSQVSQFLNNVNKSNNIRNIALIYLIANTGIRREESISIKLCDLDLENRKLKISHGKGNKQRTVLFPSNIVPILEKYINTVRNKYKYANTSPYLFLSQRSLKLNKDAVNLIFNQYNGQDITPHQLRHNYASYAIENGLLTLTEIQHQLGHTNVSTTSKYAHARESVIQEKVEGVNIGFGG